MKRTIKVLSAMLLVIAFVTVGCVVLLVDVGASAKDVSNYEEFYKAMTEANDGDVIKLTGNITADAEKTEETDRLIVSKKLTLDLGEYTINVPESLESSGNWMAIMIDSNGNLTVEATTGGIKSGSDTKDGVYAFHVANGDLTINGGNYTTGITVANVQEGTLTVNGGNFKVTDVDSNGKYGATYTINCIDANFNEGTAQIIVNGGTFYDFNPAVVHSESTNPTSYLGSDKAVTHNAKDNTYTVVDAAARIGDACYASLAEAVEAAQSGATITLLDDTTGIGIIINEDLTIDLGGHTYTAAGKPLAGSAGTETQAFQILKDNTVTIKNGKVTSEEAKMLVQNYANLTLDGVTLDGTMLQPSDIGYYTLSNNNGTTVIKNSTVIAHEGGIAFDVCNVGSGTYPNVSVTVEGNSVIKGEVEVSGTAPEYIVNGGTFTDNPSEYVAENMGVRMTDDGLYEVVSKFVDGETGVTILNTSVAMPNATVKVERAITEENNKVTYTVTATEGQDDVADFTKGESVEMALPVPETVAGVDVKVVVTHTHTVGETTTTHYYLTTVNASGNVVIDNTVGFSTFEITAADDVIYTLEPGDSLAYNGRTINNVFTRNINLRYFAEYDRYAMAEVAFTTPAGTANYTGGALKPENFKFAEGYFFDTFSPVIISGEGNVGYFRLDQSAITITNVGEIASGSLSAITYDGVAIDDYFVVNESRTEFGMLVVNAIALDNANVALTPDTTYTYNATEQTIGIVTVDATTTGENAITYVYSLVENGEYSAVAPRLKNAGSYTVYWKATADNHLGTSGSYTVKIEQAKVTLTANDGTIVYGTPSYTANGEVEGVMTGDDLEVVWTSTYKSTTTVDADAEISATYDTTNTNYDVTVVAAVLDVTPATITEVSVSQSGTLTYNASAQAPVLDKASTAVNNMTVTYKYSLTYSTDAADYSEELPTGTNADAYTLYYVVIANNHEVYFGNTTFVIGKAKVTLTANDGTIVYGTPSYTANGEVEGVMTGDDLGVVWTSTYESTTTVDADAEISATYDTTNTNYDVTVVVAVLDVTPATIADVSVSQNGTLTYNGNAQTPVITNTATAVNNMQLTWKYSLTADAYKETMPTVTLSDTYKVYYEITANNHAPAYGSFNVTVGKITGIIIKTDSYEKVYDGTPLSGSNVITFVTGLNKFVAGDNVEVASTVQITNVGYIENEPTLQVLNANDEDVSNCYEIEFSGNATLTIKAATVTPEWNIGEYTYNGNHQAPTATVVGVNGETLKLSFSYVANAETPNAGVVDGQTINAGKYTVTVTLVDGEGDSAGKAANYVISDNSSDYEIKKAGNFWTTEPSVEKNTWKYNEAFATINNGVPTFGTVEVKYFADGSDVEIRQPTNVGKYTIRFTSVGNGNYVTLTKEIEVNITPAFVKKPTQGESSYVYSENGTTFAYTDSADSALYTVDAMNGTDVGNAYTVTFKLNDTLNYEWEGNNNNENVVFTYEITAKQINKPANDTTQFIYSGNELTYVVEASEAYTVSGNKQTAAGEYDVTIALVSGNYVWEDNTTNNVVYKFVISATSTIPEGVEVEIVYNNNNVVYNGQAYTPSLGEIKVDGVKVEYEFTPDNHKQTNAGTYELTIKIASGNYKGSVVIGKWTINPYTIDTVVWGNDNVFKYTGKDLAPTATYTIFGETITFTTTTGRFVGEHEAFVTGIAGVAGGQANAENYRLNKFNMEIGYFEITEAVPVVIKSASVSIGAEYSVNFKVLATAINQYGGNFTFTMTRPGVNGEVVFDADNVDYVADGGYYVFSYTNIGPQSMGVEINAELNVAGNTNARKYSIKDYCYNMLTKNAEDEDLCTVIVNMLYYGAEAQKTKGQTSDFVTDGLTLTQQAFRKQHIDNVSVKDMSNNATYVYQTGGNVNMDNGVRIKYIVDLVGNANISDYVFKVNGDVVTPEWSSGEATADGNTRYNCYIDINMYDCDKVYTFTLELKDDAHTVVSTRIYSVESYAAEKDNALVKTLVDFSYVLKAYMGV